MNSAQVFDTTGDRAMPRPLGFDSSRALRADPYRFIATQCRALETDVFETRILLRRTICVSGPAAARLFHDTTRFERAGAACEPLHSTLFCSGGAQGVHGDARRVRKALFLELLSAQRLADLAERTKQAWRRRAATWSAGRTLVLHAQAQRVLTDAVCAWAGVPLSEQELQGGRFSSSRSSTRRRHRRGAAFGRDGSGDGQSSGCAR